jgi:hypothetical protein
MAIYGDANLEPKTCPDTVRVALHGARASCAFTL